MSRNKYLNNIEGKEIWCCDFFATRFNLQEPVLSLCHDTYAGQRLIGILSDFSPEKYYAKLEEIARDNECIDAHCRKCAKCHKEEFHFRKLTWITINTSWYCNSSCIYCSGHYASEDDGHDVIDILEKFHNDNVFDKDCLFDWGGGEPTQNITFDATVRWIIEHGYKQRINTNAIVYSEVTELALKSNRTVLRISIDSGTEKCFEKMKGHKGYKQVWNNIKRYIQLSDSDNFYIKYNVCNYNAEKVEIDAFLKNCEECGVKHVIIDGEVSSYQPGQNAGPFYYTEQVYEMMHYLENEAKRKGFNVIISDYAFSYRPEYDEHGNLMLPTKYIDNTDRNIISNNIYLETVPSINSLIDELKFSNKKTIIWGYGTVGKQAYKVLKKRGIEIKYIVDKDTSLSQRYDLEVPVISPEEYVKEKEETNVLLASYLWKEMLKFINDNNIDKCRPLYLQEIYFVKYLEECGE